MTNMEIAEGVFLEKWKDKYSVDYAWNYGRDRKRMKEDVLPYFMKAFKEHWKEKYSKAIDGYLKDEDAFLIKNQHQFTRFAYSPHRWAVSTKKVQKVGIPSILNQKMELERVMQRWKGVDESVFIEKVMIAASDNPIQFFKGFLQTNKHLKISNPILWKKAASELASLIGKDRAKKMWVARENMLESIE